MISAGAKEYNSGSSIYVGDLKVGDIIGNGSVLHPSMEARMGVTTAELTIDGKQIKIRQSAAETYTTDRPLRVDSIKYSVYSKNICAYSLKTYDEENDLQKTYKNHSHIYVGDMKVGDIVGAGATLHTSGDGSGCSAFEVYLDESSKRANDSYFEWCPSQPIRLVSTEKDFYSPNKLIMRFETFYAEGEVGSEASLNAALNRDEVIVLANNIELSDCFFVRDGKEHTLDLNGYTLSRNMAGKAATGHVFQVNKGSKLTIKDSSTEHSGLITGGLAPNGGGAIYVDDAPADHQAILFESCIFRGNRADRDGGAFFVCDDGVALSNTEITKNSAKKRGGAVFVDARYGITVRGLVTIDNNTCDDNKSMANLTLENSTFIEAKIMNAGLYKGSHIAIGTTAASGKTYLSNSDFSKYQTRYFSADEGKIDFSKYLVRYSLLTTSASIFG
ncbi:MAG: hypothetical protein VZR73_16010, partial [Acutalibacteraceae bacterium]|nr:hypothetical protein [Acutalibacteraceae bacterium]